MTIIVSKNGKDAKWIKPADVAREDYLQKYIYDNPSAIPLDSIKEDIRLFILAREFATPSGPIDVLGIDRDGDIFVVETKLYKNPDKRLVVAQVLDYGAALWSGYEHFDEFIATIEQYLAKQFPKGLRITLAKFFDLAEGDVAKLLDRLKGNLDQGRF